MTCAAKGCSKPVPEIARSQGDPYCSSVCFRLAHGYSVKVGAHLLPGETDDGLEDYGPTTET